jgi:hypothetical protein
MQSCRALTWRSSSSPASLCSQSLRGSCRGCWPWRQSSGLEALQEEEGQQEALQAQAGLQAALQLRTLAQELAQELAEELAEELALQLAQLAARGRGQRQLPSPEKAQSQSCKRKGPCQWAMLIAQPARFHVGEARTVCFRKREEEGRKESWKLMRRS